MFAKVLTKTKEMNTINTNIFSCGGMKMITNLHIKNIGIIDDITIDLNDGFNVLTGETGAGKTLIIGTLRNYIRRTFFKRNDKKGRKLLLC